MPTERPSTLELATRVFKALLRHRDPETGLVLASLPRIVQGVGSRGALGRRFVMSHLAILERLGYIKIYQIIQRESDPHYSEPLVRVLRDELNPKDFEIK